MTLTFTPVDLGQQSEYRPYFEACPQQASDYSFLNLWSWARAHELEWAFTDTLVWIRQKSPAALSWAPVGDWERIDWKACKSDHPELFRTFTRVPKDLARLWERVFGADPDVEAERDQWDYIYDAGALASLKGNRFHKKKTLVNQFKKKYGYAFKEIDADLADRAMALQADWCTWRTCETSAQLAAENLAIMRTLQNWSALEGLMGGCISVDDLIVAFTVGEVLPQNTLLIHFEKGCPGYKGIYQAINQMFVERYAKDRIQWVNREPDLGDEGLRKAKLSYHPEGFIEKYRVRFPS